jgi:hypothetical protein
MGNLEPRRGRDESECHGKAGFVLAVNVYDSSMASAMDFELMVAGLIGSRESIKEDVESGDLNKVG